MKAATGFGAPRRVLANRSREGSSNARAAPAAPAAPAASVQQPEQDPPLDPQEQEPPVHKPMHEIKYASSPLINLFAEEVADALCFDSKMYCDPYSVAPGTQVFMVVHMPDVLDHELAPFNTFRVALVPSSEFATTRLGASIQDLHSVMNTVVVSTQYTESMPLQTIYGANLGSAPCDKSTAEVVAGVAAKMWAKGPAWGPHDVKPWEDAFNVVDVAGVVLYASRCDARNDYFVGLIKETMTKCMWQCVCVGKMVLNL